MNSSFFFKAGNRKNKTVLHRYMFLTYTLLSAVGFEICLRKHLELIQPDQPGFEA